MFRNALTAAITLFALAMPVAAEVVVPLGGGFRTDAAAPDAHSVECQATIVDLAGFGGVVRSLTTDAVLAEGTITAVVVSEFAPVFRCGEGTLLIFTADENTLIYLHAPATAVAFGD